MIRQIDMETYARREHFHHFRAMVNPFASVTVQMEITHWLQAVKAEGKPFFLSFQYAVAKAANRIPELRQRIRNEGIVEYDSCGASYIVATPDGTYRYCDVITELPFSDYLSAAQAAQSKAIRSEHLSESPDPEQFFYISCLPRMSYASLEMPFPDASFSVPSITWGKYYEESSHIRIPVTLMVNHALVDGLHISRFFHELESELENEIG